MQEQKKDMNQKNSTPTPTEQQTKKMEDAKNNPK